MNPRSTDYEADALTTTPSPLIIELFSPDGGRSLLLRALACFHSLLGLTVTKITSLVTTNSNRFTDSSIAINKKMIWLINYK